KLDYFNKASNTFYDDTNSGFGNNTNTVQKAIEKLKSGKQDSLTEGNNINLNGSNISVIGGTSKEYVLENNYFINDLIIKDEKIYRVDEDFISSDWSTDRAKLTLISSGGGGGSTEAIDVSFDNSKTNLEYISGYDFPKFKTPIPDTINLILTDVNKTTEYPATITKQPDGSVILNASFNEEPELSGNIIFAIKSVEGNSSIYNIYSKFSQFFEIGLAAASDLSQLNYFNLETNECTISGISDSLKAAIAWVSIDINNSFIAFVIAKQDNTPIPVSNYNITLNIKNRVLRNEDINIFYINTNFQHTIIPLLSNLELNEIGNSVKLQGSFTSSIPNVGNLDGLFFYSPIIENYFNISDDPLPTSGITSSSGKEVKFYLFKAEDSVYILALGYQDGSEIQQGDVFTFNLTPDKNSTLAPVYSPVANVQQLGEALNEKIDKEVEIIVDEKIPDIYDYSGAETLTNKIAKFSDGSIKPIYRTCIEKDYVFLKDDKDHSLIVFEKDEIMVTNGKVFIKKDDSSRYVDSLFLIDTAFFRLILGEITIILFYHLNPYEPNYTKYMVISEYYKR
ncbi:phage tail protein, partial [Brachyspira intermedia]